MTDKVPVITIDTSIQSDEQDVSTSRAKSNGMNQDELPEKSRVSYIVLYNSFLNWCKSSGHNVNNLKEIMIVDFFKNLSEKKKTANLWPYYSMLKRTLMLYKQIDISKYKSLNEIISNHSRGYIPNASKAFTADDLKKFLSEAPDDMHLATKICLIIGIAGSCKREDLHSLQMKHIEDTGEKMYITLPASKNGQQRTVVITDYFYQLIKRYILLRPANCNEKNFLINYQRGRCTKQVIGINKIGNMAQKVAQYLKKSDSERYTFRKTAPNLLIKAAAEIMQGKNKEKFQTVGVTTTRSSDLLIHKKPEMTIELIKPINKEVKGISSNDNRDKEVVNSSERISFTTKSSDQVQSTNFTNVNSNMNFDQLLNFSTSSKKRNRPILFSFSNCNNISFNIYNKDK